MVLIRKTRIKNWLERNNITQNELARKVGCSLPFMNGLTNRKNINIRIGLLHNISLVTGIPEQELISDLLFGHPDSSHFYFKQESCVSSDREAATKQQESKSTGRSNDR